MEGGVGRPSRGRRERKRCVPGQEREKEVNGLGEERGQRRHRRAGPTRPRGGPARQARRLSSVAGRRGWHVG